MRFGAIVRALIRAPRNVVARARARTHRAEGSRPVDIYGFTAFIRRRSARLFGSRLRENSLSVRIVQLEERRLAGCFKQRNAKRYTCRIQRHFFEAALFLVDVDSRSRPESTREWPRVVANGKRGGKSIVDD
jgi:hypothetical protein